MASIGHDAGGRRRILFYAADGSRKTIRLGKCSKRDAETVLRRVEALLAIRITGGEPSRDLALWLADLGPQLRERLDRAGLIGPAEPAPKKQIPTLDAFLDDFMARHGDGKKPGTITVWRQVMRMLREYLPADLPIDQITAGHAKEFLGKLRARGLASATVHKRVGFARQFFQDAVDWELIDRNPFSRIKTASSSVKSNVDVPRETIDLVLKHCDTAWATIVGLSRYGGLRCPSEVLSLRWDDVDWEGDRMSVPEPKVEHHEGRGVRSVPLFPELREIIARAWDAAPAGAEFVVNKPAYREAAIRPGGWGNANLRTHFLRILRRAGVPPWPRLFHSMRASRQTELERQFPRHVVCAWMGNTTAVAERNYLLVTESDFAAAVEGQNGAVSAARNPARLVSKAARNPAPQGLARSTQGAAETPENTGENAVFPVFRGTPKVEVDGLEPTTLCLQSRCSPN